MKLRLAGPRAAALIIAIAASAALSANARAPLDRMMAANWLDLVRGGDRASSPLPADTWQRLEKSKWIEDGRSGAPRTVYVFTDPNCPLCSRFWVDARPWVNAGKVQLRHVLVAVIDESSAGKAAALLSSREPAVALARYESHPQAAHGQAESTIDPGVRRELDANEALMHSLKAPGTPTIVYRDSSGAVRKFEGAPSSEMLNAILGPR